MNAQSFLKLGIATAVVAGLIFAYFFTGAGVAIRPSYAVTKPEVNIARIVALEDELAEMRQKLQQVQDVNLVNAVSKRVAVENAADGSNAATLVALEDILERLRAVEEGLAKRLAFGGGQPGDAYQAGVIDGGERGQIIIRRGRGLTPQDVLDYQSQATNALASEEEKIRALRALRGNQDEFGDARNRDVVLSMIDLVETSEDPDVRADIYRQLSGVTEPDLKRPLLYSLANDSSAEVREEAAETLEDYLPDSEVLAALRYAADNDQSKDVREQARESME